MILVDTSVWVDFLRGEDSSQRQALHRLIEDEADISMTEIIFTEILQGIKHDGEFQAIKGYLLEFPMYRPKGIETYIHAARIYRDCRKNGKTVRRTIDCIIAAICIENNLALLHKDSDFNLIQACTGLQILRGAFTGLHSCTTSQATSPFTKGGKLFYAPSSKRKKGALIG